MRRRLLFIITGFTISFLLVAALSLIALSRFSSLITHTGKVDKSNRSLTLIARLENALRNVDRYERGFLLTKDSTYLEQGRSIKLSFDSALTEFRELNENDIAQLNTTALLRTDMLHRMDAASANISATTSDTILRLSPYYDRGRNLTLECFQHLNVMREREERKLAEQTKERNENQAVASTSIRTLSIVFGIVSLLLFALMLYEIRRGLLYHDALHEKMKELQNTHSELEQIAFATSHDLQEPLRKIQIFIDRLRYMRRDGNDGDINATLERISTATNGMQNLVQDLSILTNLVNGEELQNVNIEDVVAHAEKELSEKIASLGAVVTTEGLPVLLGRQHQLEILFRALLDNALKFARDGVEPQVHVACSLVSSTELRDLDQQLLHREYYCISVTDNGIGFDNKFAPKMFHIFKQLHNQQAGYEGRGIGLAICQRVMVNHKGHITAYGHPSAGATFKLYFPISKPID